MPRSSLIYEITLQIYVEASSMEICFGAAFPFTKTLDLSASRTLDDVSSIIAKKAKEPSVGSKKCRVGIGEWRWRHVGVVWRGGTEGWHGGVEYIRVAADPSVLVAVRRPATALTSEVTPLRSPLR